MKAIRIIGLIVGILAICYYAYQLFGNPNGKKYTYNDKHHVYYKGDGVTEDDAKKVGTYLNGIGLFSTDNEMDVQINEEKKSNDLSIKFIVDKEKITPETENAFITIGNDIAAKIYPDKTLHIILADDHFDDIKEVGIAKASQTQSPSSTDTNQKDDEK